MQRGTRLGPYEIVSRLGAGGMGEVWRGRDTRLGREVAIKMLPAEFAADAKLRMRLEREAKAIAALNHPHICALHDVGPDYLVMELCEGRTLANQIASGPMPMERVITYGAQIADALDKAHRAGIVHRDLKPSNVMITKSGVKLLDFGLAMRLSSSNCETSTSTYEPPLTNRGEVVGTLRYMAPEQLAGEEADARSDLFALGAVLYEMVTGHRAFEGETRTSVAAAIMSGEPRPMTELEPLVPPALDHVVKKCLAKERDERWQSAADIAEDLRWVGETGSGSVAALPIGGVRRRLKWMLAAAAVSGWTAAVVAVIWAGVFISRMRSSARLIQTEIAQPIVISAYAPLAISPDGRRLAMVVSSEYTLTVLVARQLLLRDLSEGGGRLLAGTEGAGGPFWSPDGQALGFFANGKLKVINVGSGAIQTLSDAGGGGGAWSPRGVILFRPPNSAAIFAVRESGGHSVPVTKPVGFTSHRPLTFLPDGIHFLYTSFSSVSSKYETHVGSIEGVFDRKILDYASPAAVVNGWLLTVKDRNLIAQRFDADSLGLEGNPIPIAQNIDWYAPARMGTFAASADTLVYQQAAQPRRQFVYLDNLKARPVVAGVTAFWSNAAVSPDGMRVIADRKEPGSEGSDLWMFDLAGASATRLTFTAYGNSENGALFSADGRRIALGSHKSAANESQFWIQPLGGGAHEVLMPAGETWFALEDWSRDGKRVLIDALRPGTGWDIEVVHLDRDRTPAPLIRERGAQQIGQFSPDGKWVCYRSDESGRAEIYVTTYPGATAKWQVSTTGGSEARWSADGGQLFYLAEGRVMVTSVHASGGSFSTDEARPVTSLGDHIVGLALAHSGRILALRELDPGKPPVTVVYNWQKLLERP